MNKLLRKKLQSVFFISKNITFTASLVYGVFFYIYYFLDFYEHMTFSFGVNFFALCLMFLYSLSSLTHFFIKEPIVVPKDIIDIILAILGIVIYLGIPVDSEDYRQIVFIKYFKCTMFPIVIVAIINIFNIWFFTGNANQRNN